VDAAFGDAPADAADGSSTTPDAAAGKGESNESGSDGPVLNPIDAGEAGH
jgi:hypothetical protein